jgi:hypothetical protein
MADVAIIERDVVVPGEARAGSSLSWSAAIAGALAATAVTFLIIALGSGIGLSFASPYSGPSAKAMTIAAAVWLLMAETMGFATGGYLAGRLRSPAYDGVIGVKKELVVGKFLNGMPVRFEPATGDVRLCAVVIDCDENTGRAEKIERLMLS